MGVRASGTPRKKAATKAAKASSRKRSASKKATTKKPGRPRKPQRNDLDQVEELAAIGLPEGDIGRIVYGLSRQGFSGRKRSDPELAARIETGQSSGKRKLLSKMWGLAVDDGNPTMCIWLSKQYLGFADKSETQVTERKPLIIREEGDLARLEGRVAAQPKRGKGAGDQPN